MTQGELHTIDPAPAHPMTRYRKALIASPRWTLLAVLLMALGYLKVQHTPPAYHTSLDAWADGGYYLEIAQHVRDGNGLSTNVSLMHKGYPHFPHPTSVYPAWPLVLGLLARLVPLDQLAVKLPVLLYFASLVFAYLFAYRLLPVPFFPKRFPGFDAGHVLVLILGLHAGFFRATSSPLTEGLGYTLLFAGLWLGIDAWRSPSLRRGLALGLWLAMLFLTRSQFVVVIFAAVITSAVKVCVGANRRAHWPMLAGMLVGMLPLIGWHYAFISGFVLDPSPMSLLRFDQNRVTDFLSPVPSLKQTDGLWDFIADRAQGFPLAWAQQGPYAFSRSFHLFHYALPPALLLSIFYGARALRRGAFAQLGDWLRSDDASRWIFFGVLSLTGYLSIHLIHKATWSAWNFGLRQALTCTLLFFAAHCLLLKSRIVPAAALSVFLLCSGTFVGAQRLYGAAVSASRQAVPITPPNPVLVTWLHQQRANDPTLTIAMQTPHRMAPYVRGVGFHAILRMTTSVGDLRTMVDKLNVSYIVLATDKRTQNWRLLVDGASFDRYFKFVASVDNLTVWAPRWTPSRPDGAGAIR